MKMNIIAAIFVKL